jgi:geranylgeranyl pyrophosphate synthase
LRKSINAIYGDKFAIMVGDILFARALEFLIDYDKETIEHIANIAQ